MSNPWLKDGKMKLASAFILTLLAVAQARASQSTNGAWIIHDLAIDIFDCQNALCGKIIWLGNAALRPDQCGKRIIWGLLPDDNEHWSRGTILDPNNGKSYSLSAAFEPNGTLKARIFHGTPLLGKTEILRRVDLQTLADKC
ncbi:DUF2147 domain-containing protein [Rhodopila sp.]|uniref:DUF2147 domain-containing protein n=1 Tax=Rhodopila sp. TaxID=2480087 RepID=UPI003D0D03DF